MVFTSFLNENKDFRLYWGNSKVMFKKISQNFVKSPLKFCLISQILLHSLWHVCITNQYLLPTKATQTLIRLGNLYRSCTDCTVMQMDLGPCWLMCHTADHDFHFEDIFMPDYTVYLDGIV